MECENFMWVFACIMQIRNNFFSPKGKLGFVIKFQVRSKYSGKTFVVAESRLSDLPSEKPKSNAANGPSGDSKKSKTKGSSGEKTKDSAADSYEVLEKFFGASLVGTK